MQPDFASLSPFFYPSLLILTISLPFLLMLRIVSLFCLIMHMHTETSCKVKDQFHLLFLFYSVLFTIQVGKLFSYIFFGVFVFIKTVELRQEVKGL